jgi:hypothetical protein
MVTLKIDVMKIDKNLLFSGKNGAKYLDVALMDNRDGPSEYGDDGFCVQSVSKEAREAGKKGPIIGNWRNIETRAKAKPAPTPAKKQPDPDLDGEDDSCPF